MKNLLLILILISGICLNSCKKDKDSLTLPPELATVKGKIQLSIDSLDNQLSAAVTSLASSGVDSALVRNKLVQLYNASSFTKEVCFVNSQFILQIIEPPQYYQFQGANFSNDPNLTAVFNGKQPVLTNLFHAIEGFDAVANIYPVVSSGQSIGLVESLFVPQDILGRIIMPIIKNQDFDIWVMQNNGVEIFDQDPSTVGLNIFTDPIYDSFASLKEAAQKIANNTTGEASYSFYMPGTTTIAKKKCYWDTFTIHSTEWKIVWSKPE